MYRFTKQAEAALKMAYEAARNMKHNYIGTEHLLLGLRQEFSGVAGQILVECGVDTTGIEKLIDELIAPGITVSVKDRDGYTPRLEAIIDDASQFAKVYGSQEIGTEYLLLAIVRDIECQAARILSCLNVQLNEIYTKITTILGADLDEMMSSQGKGEGKGEQLLTQFGKDLTKLAAEGKLDPIIGRRTEITRIIQILSRKTKNNPCLVGEPGVGKSAIVEGLAQCIASGNVPSDLASKQVIALDLAGMVAGTKYRGEFEERMKNLIEEVQRDGNVILFMDEVHTLIGAGGSEGALDAAGILKPALARGEFQMIGATTIDEYKKKIEKDAALERRFAPVKIDEPGEAMSIEILSGLKETYEKFHKVTISNEALSQAVKLSARYISDRNLPDKAIDVLDEACSKTRLSRYRVKDFSDSNEARLEELKRERDEALKAHDIERSKEIHREYGDVRRKMEKSAKRRSKADNKPVVSENMVANVVSEWTGIPLSKLCETESARLLNLEKTIHRRVIGQEEAVSAVARAVKRGRAGLKDPGRPIGSFLFLGPTGVGKTELSKALAEALFANENAMIRIDMSEYMEKHSISKLIGSPPGYVGHEEGGQLSDKVRRNPYSVILFDEIEKAHPDVFNILLQVLDDGHITDSQGRMVDFKNTVIIMTSNAGAGSIIEPKKLGFAAVESEEKDYSRMKDGVMEEVKRIFKPEFINRIDEIIVFHALTDGELRKIAGLMLRTVSSRLLEQMNIKLSFRESVRDFIVKKGSDRKYGARPLRRAIQVEIEDYLADAVLLGELKSGDSGALGIRNGKLHIYK